MKRIKVIACEIAFRELCLCASKAKNIVDFSFLEKGLHDMGQKLMSARIQKEIDSTDKEKYSAIVLVYGLCNNGIVGLHSELPMIVPKAHDCITFFMGSKEKYSEFFNENLGSYFYTSGWLERETNPSEVENSVTSQLGLNKSYDDYVEEFGEENADYIMEILGSYHESYSKIVFIDTKVGDIENYRKKLYEKADKSNWDAIEMDGDNSLLMNLLNGEWNENDFLLVPPNKTIIASNDKNIIGYV